MSAIPAETLNEWLRGAHNYPREMDFYLTQTQVDRFWPICCRCGPRSTGGVTTFERPSLTCQR